MLSSVLLNRGCLVELPGEMFKNTKAWGFILEQSIFGSGAEALPCLKSFSGDSNTQLVLRTSGWGWGLKRRDLGCRMAYVEGILCVCCFGWARSALLLLGFRGDKEISFENSGPPHTESSHQPE